MGDDWVTVGHVIKHVMQILYYRFAEDAVVGSSLMAPKDKGEGKESVTYQGTCGADNVQNSCRLCSCFWWPIISLMGRNAPGGSKHTQIQKWL